MTDDDAPDWEDTMETVHEATEARAQAQGITLEEAGRMDAPDPEERRTSLLAAHAEMTRRDLERCGHLSPYRAFIACFCDDPDDEDAPDPAPASAFILTCCCVCGQDVTRAADGTLWCPDHYEVNEAVCDSLNPPGWRDDIICASDRGPQPSSISAGEVVTLPKYWMRSRRHG